MSAGWIKEPIDVAANGIFGILPSHERRAPDKF
jgi:hypothetical protein